MRNVWVLIMVVIMATGCSVLDKFMEEPKVAELITTELTERFVTSSSDPQERATRVITVIQKMGQTATGSYSLLELVEAVEAEIEWDRYSMEEQQNMRFAFNQADRVIRYLVRKNVIDADDRYNVDSLLDWIYNAAERVQLGLLYEASERMPKRE